MLIISLCTVRYTFVVNFTEMQKSVKLYEIIAKKGETPTIMLHGYIGQDDMINSVDFMREFDAATENCGEVIFNINSGGGSVIQGFSIVDQIKTRGKKITTQVFGMAGSMGFVLMLLGDKIQISRNSNILVHRVSGGGFGDADSLREVANKCQEFEESIIKMTIERTKLPEETVRTWFKSGVDKWFNATEALKMNLVDEVIGGDGDAPKVAQNMSEKEVFNQFYNKFNTEKVMKESQLKLLGLPKDATDDEVEGKIKQITAENKAMSEKIEKIESDAAETLFQELGLPEDKKQAFMNVCKQAGIEQAKLVFENVKLGKGGEMRNQSISDAIRGFQNQPHPEKDTRDWTYIDWAKKNPEGLKNMSKEDRDKLKK